MRTSDTPARLATTFSERYRGNYLIKGAKPIGTRYMNGYDYAFLIETPDGDMWIDYNADGVVINIDRIDLAIDSGYVKYMFTDDRYKHFDKYTKEWEHANRGKLVSKRFGF